MKAFLHAPAALERLCRGFSGKNDETCHFPPCRVLQGIWCPLRGLLVDVSLSF